MSEDHNNFINGSATDSRESFGIVEGNTPLSIQMKNSQNNKKIRNLKNLSV